MLGGGQLGIVVGLDIMCPHHHQAVAQQRLVLQQQTAMQPLEEDGIAVLHKSLHQRLAVARRHDERPTVEHPQGRHIAAVVAHLVAEALQLRRLPATVVETMEMDVHAGFRQSLEAIEDIYHPAVVGRQRDVERHNMQMLFFFHFSKPIG